MTREWISFRELFDSESEPDDRGISLEGDWHVVDDEKLRTITFPIISKPKEPILEDPPDPSYSDWPKDRPEPWNADAGGT